jgi:hypothetical protein
MYLHFIPEGAGRRAVLAVAAYAALLAATNGRVAVFEDEATIVALARKASISTSLQRIASGALPHEHPPLADAILHYWLRWTHESFSLLRAPSLLFYCLGLWVVAEAAELLWKARWCALALGVAWPAGFYLGRPAGWYGLSVLELAAVTLFYLRWRISKRAAWLVALGGTALLLVYTNYFGWVFLALWSLDLAIDADGRKLLPKYFLAMTAVAALQVPLIPAIAARAAASSSRFWETAPKSLYLTYSLLPGEMAAPWAWPGVVAVVAGCGLLILGLRCPACRRPLLWLAGPLLIAFLTSVLAGQRLVLFAPALLLFLTSVVRFARRGVALVLVAAAFGAGWLGVLTGRYAGTFRYLEPWPEVVRRVLEVSQPGDLVLCSHPSFYFYLSYQIPWSASRGLPAEPVAAAGRLWAAPRRPGIPAAQVVFVDTATTPGFDSVHRELRRSGGWGRTEVQRWLPDPGWKWKRRFYPAAGQPEWRIRLEIWTKPEAGPGPAAALP